LTDIGLASVLLALAIFMLWRLYDLFTHKGQWAKEMESEKKRNTEAEIIEKKRKLEELTAELEEVSK